MSKDLHFKRADQNRYIIAITAGSVVIRVNSSDDHDEERRSVKPMNRWWVYIKESRI